MADEAVIVTTNMHHLSFYRRALINAMQDGILEKADVTECIAELDAYCVSTRSEAPEPSGSMQSTLFKLAPQQNLEAAVQEVFLYYLDVVGRNSKTYTFTPLRRHRGIARLRDALKMSDGDLPEAVQLMKAAVDQLTRSDFHMGRDANSGGKRYCDWERNLFKSTEQFQNWLEGAQENALLESACG